MRREGGLLGGLDWATVLIYLVLITWGWFNIYASVYDPETAKGLFDLSTSSGKQLLWICISMVIIIAILVIDFRVYESFSPILYVLFILLLMAVLVLGTKVNGARAWFQIGPFRFQPAEFAKFATALVLAKYISGTNIKLSNLRHQFIAVVMLFVPVGLIILQPDAGSAMVFLALLIPLYREGFPGWYLITGLSLATLLILTYLMDRTVLILVISGLVGLFIALMEKSRRRIVSLVFIGVVAIGLVFGTDYVFTDVLKEYQRARIDVILKPNQVNKQKEGWNLEQSKIAIGSGGITGKGFLNGTQTKFGYVPEQSTDFIFSTLAEEQGWIGSLLLVALFITLLLRVVHLAERQKYKFARMYGYSVAAIFFFHFTVNIAMTIGLFPVVGIPLPFFSYGGSSFISFTIMLFVLLKIDMHRSQVLMRS